MLRQPLPIEKYRSQRVQVTLFDDKYPNCAPQAPPVSRSLSRTFSPARPGWALNPLSDHVKFFENTPFRLRVKTNAKGPNASQRAVSQPCGCVHSRVLRLTRDAGAGVTQGHTAADANVGSQSATCIRPGKLRLTPWPTMPPYTIPVALTPPSASENFPPATTEGGGDGRAGHKGLGEGGHAQGTERRRRKRLREREREGEDGRGGGGGLSAFGKAGPRHIMAGTNGLGGPCGRMEAVDRAHRHPKSGYGGGPTSATPAEGGGGVMRSADAGNTRILPLVVVLPCISTPRSIGLLPSLPYLPVLPAPQGRRFGTWSGPGQRRCETVGRCSPLQTKRKYTRCPSLTGGQQRAEHWCAARAPSTVRGF